MFWWLNPISPCSDPSLVKPVKLPFGDSGDFSETSNLDNCKFVFGRKADCSIRLKDQSISGHHCTLHIDYSTKELFLSDTSTNGTFLNGKRLTKSIPVQVTDGDIISLTRPKIMDDNISFHAVFKLVFSSTNPLLMNDQPEVGIVETGITEETIQDKINDISELEVSINDSNNLSINEDGLLKETNLNKDTTNNFNEKKLPRSSMNLRSQERRGRLNLKNEGRTEEPISRRSRSRSKTSEKESQEMIPSETNIPDNKIKVDKISLDSVENGEETTRNERSDKEEAVKYITEVEKLSEQYNLTVENISQLFDVSNQSQEISSDFVQRKSIGKGIRDSTSKNSNIENMSAFISSGSQNYPFSRRSTDNLMEKLDNLELLISKKESLERSLRSELEVRNEEISRLKELLNRSELNEQQARQHNMNLMDELQKIQRQNLDVEHELIDYQEKCRVLSASGEAMDQTITQLSEELSSIRQELLIMNEKYNQQSLALRSLTQLTQKKCLSILHSLKDIHQISNTYGYFNGVSTKSSLVGNHSNINFNVNNSTVTPWRNTKRALPTQYNYNTSAIPQTERPYKMRYSPSSSKINMGNEFNYRRVSSGNNFSSFSDDLESIRNSISNNTNIPSVSTNIFHSGSAQLEEQLLSNIKLNSVEYKHATNNQFVAGNKGSHDRISIDDSEYRNIGAIQVQEPDENCHSHHSNNYEKSSSRIRKSIQIETLPDSLNKENSNIN